MNTHFYLRYIAIVLCFSLEYAYSYDIKVANKDGIELCYNILADGESVEFTFDKRITSYKDTIYTYITTDTLYIPEKIVYGETEYVVSAISSRAFSYMNPKVKVVWIPNTVQDIYYEGHGNDYGAIRSSFGSNRFEEIIVDKENPYFTSKDGILYTKDFKTLIAYPAYCPKDSVFLEEGIAYIAQSAFVSSYNITFIELPLSLTKIGSMAFCDAERLTHIILKDNVDSILYRSFDAAHVSHVTLGSGLKYVDDLFLITDTILQLYCRASNPPSIRRSDQFMAKFINPASSLYVPRKSLNLYKQAEGWKNFQNIYPIEPPIVSGVNEAEVSWVQNFSATGYVWTLYLDEAQTQPYLQLTFDKDGHLTNIDLNRPNVPQLPAEEGDKQEDKRYAEYYSFTITGLDADTKYYYTRQSLAGEKVIDEETGSFETLPDGAPTGINPLLFEPSPQKTFEKGRLIINHNGNRYDVSGAKAE